MTTFPILAREFKRAAAKRWLLRVRLCSAVAAVAAGAALIHGAPLWSSAAGLGRQIFFVLTWGAFWLCLSSGVFLTAGLLCEERREGSLSLLFLTDVRGLDIILGKLGAAAPLAIQAVLGIAPVLAVTIALGGVSLAEFWRAVLVLILTLLFSLSAGLLVSVFHKTMARATLMTILFISGFVLLLGMADWLMRSQIGLTQAGMIVPGPFQAMASVPDPVHKLPPQSFGASLGILALVQAAFLALASVAVKRLALADETESSRPKVNPADGWAARRPYFRHNPIFWLALRHRWRWLTLWVSFSFLLLAWVGFMAVFDFSINHTLAGLFIIAPALHLVLKVLIASEAAERFRACRRSGELELLLVTPLSPAKLFRGHFKGLLRQFFWPVFTILLVDLTIVFLHGTQAKYGAQETIAGYLLIYALGIMLIIDFPALVWRGFWNGLSAPSAVHGVRRTLAEVLVFPWPIFLVTLIISPVVYFFALFSDSGTHGWIIGCIIWWWTVSFVWNHLLQRNARSHLRRAFRSLVTT